MSTLRVAAINHPSASSGGLAISASGNVTGAGLDLITTQSFSAVSSVSVNNCWTAMHDDYRVILNALGSTATGISLRLRVSGADATTNYSGQLLQAVGSSASAGALSTDRMDISDVGTAYDTEAFFEISRPFLAQPTSALGFMGRSNMLRVNSCLHSASTSYTGFTLYPNAGNFTGSVTVYGYRK